MLGAIRAAVLLGLVGAAGCGEPTVEVQEASDPAATARSDGGAPPPEPIRRESPDGLVVRVFREGTGPRAGIGDRVVLHYRGVLASTGEEFRSTWKRGIPDELTLGRRGLIPGLERALLGMRAGTRAEVDVPSALAYGERGLGSIPPSADLRFELDLLDVR